LVRRRLGVVARSSRALRSASDRIGPGHRRFQHEQKPFA
jgi:hypothetical protein